MLQFATVYHKEKAALGIMITASHNPKEYIGLKCCTGNARAVNLVKVGPILLDMIETNSLVQAREK